MKKIAIPFLAVLYFSCHSSKNAPKTAPVTINSSCPEDGICDFEILPNKSIEIKTDSFGKIYYKLTENTDSEVYHYNFSEKATDTTLADASYREEILFELKKNSEVNLSNEKLQETKMLFGVFCFCKGKAGYYTVNKGFLSKTKDQVKLTISDVVSNQKTKQISGKIKKGAK